VPQPIHGLEPIPRQSVNVSAYVMSDFYQPPSRASGTETALRGIATTGATTMVGYQNASLYKIDHPCWVSLLATVGDRGWSYALEKTGWRLFDASVD
jgi:hypothetical protein